MKAVVWTKYGGPDVIQVMEVEKPTPRDNEVLIRVAATTVTAGDCEVRSLKFPLWVSIPMRLYMGIRKPQRVTILGQELAGEIEAVGRAVTRFKVGDAVFGTTGLSLGTCAEYACVPVESEDGVLAHKPANLSYEEAAAVPTGGLEALHFLRLAHMKAGEKLLINGAGGSIGTAAVQLARYFGADVTAVDSAEKLEMLRSIGAGRVIDYRREDFTSSEAAYDVVFDVVGKGEFSRVMKTLRPGGRYLIANPRLSHMVRGRWASARSDRQVMTSFAGRRNEDLLFLCSLIEAGHFRPVLDRRWPLEQTAEAHRYIEAGHKKGNVAIIVGHDTGQRL